MAAQVWASCWPGSVDNQGHSLLAISEVRTSQGYCAG